MKKFYLFIFLLLFVSTCFAQIGENEPDSRIKKILDAADLSYSITEQGNFKIVFKLSDERTQVVIISSETTTYKDLEIREVRSPVLICEKKNCSYYDRETLFDLLEENKAYKVGFWAIHGSSSPYILYFCVQISANASKDIVDLMARLAATEADEKELKLTGLDKY